MALFYVNAVIPILKNIIFYINHQQETNINE